MLEGILSNSFGKTTLESTDAHGASDSKESCKPTESRAWGTMQFNHVDGRLLNGVLM